MVSIIVCSVQAAHKKAREEEMSRVVTPLERASRQLDKYGKKAYRMGTTLKPGVARRPSTATCTMTPVGEKRITNGGGLRRQSVATARGGGMPSVSALGGGGIGR